MLSNNHVHQQLHTEQDLQERWGKRRKKKDDFLKMKDVYWREENPKKINSSREYKKERKS